MSELVPELPDMDLIRDMYFEKRAKITNVRPAIPPVTAKQKKFLPPPPDD